MRWLLTCLTVMLLVQVVIPDARGQSEILSDHGRSYTDLLGPGEQHVYNVTFAGAPLIEAWIFMLSAQVVGDLADEVEFRFSLPAAGNQVASWNWTVDGAVHSMLATLPQTSYYELAVTNGNGSTGPVNYSFQFDQSCNCLAKRLDLEGGMMLFQMEVNVSDRVYVAFDQRGSNYQLSAAVRNSGPLAWPDGFDLVGVGEEEEGWLILDYIAATAGVHYFFISSISGTGWIIPIVDPPPEPDPATGEGLDLNPITVVAATLLTLVILFSVIRLYRVQAALAAMRRGHDEE